MNIVWEKIVFKNLMSYGDSETTFYFNKSPTTLITGRNGSGKAQPLNSLLCTPNGFIKMKDVKINDKVACTDGTFSNVIGVWPQGIKDIYRITLKDGKTVECSGDHLWTGYYTGRKKTLETYTTKDILTTIESKKSNTRNHFSGFILPLVSPIDFNINNILPMSPYLLGVLLGDGGISGNDIRITNPDLYITNKCRAIVEAIGHNLVTTDNLHYRLNKGKSNGEIKTTLKELSLLGTTSGTKFIPSIYKTSSIQERYELLQGLIDTDGWVSKGGNINYNTISKQLCDDIVDIVESLGGYCSITTKLPKFTHNGVKKCGKLSYNVYIKIQDPFKIISLPRKKERIKVQQSYNRIIKKIEYVRDDECQCISVDHPNHLYLTDNYIPTHNSTIIEAFVFAIKGNTYRGSNKADLINTINKKDCLVKLYFEKGGSKYEIHRGMKPNIFFIVKDGKKIDESASIRDMQQYLESHVLQTPINGIIKTSILGCDYKPFMMMSSKEKRELIECILEIDIFTDMNKHLKSVMSSFKDNYAELQSKIHVTDSVLAVKKEMLDNMQNKTKKDNTKDKEELMSLKMKLNSIKSEIEQYNQGLQNLQYDKDISTIKDNVEELTQQLNKVKFDVENKKALITKMKQINGTCDECASEVSQEHKDNHIIKYEAEIKDFAVSGKAIFNERALLLKDIAEYDDYIYKKNNMTNMIRSLVTQHDSINEIFENKTQEYKIKLKSESLDITHYITEYNNTITELAALKETEEEYLYQKQIHGIASQLLKDDGIKSYIVEQYIPILNQSVNYYLKCLNSQLVFNIDKNLDVRLDLRYPGEFNYYTLSMGERQRIDLSMSFAWRKLASIKNSINTNLLILDETFDASIDMDGVDDLLTILQDLRRTGVNVFVISHKGGLEDKLLSTIRVEKINQFSKFVTEKEFV